MAEGMAEGIAREGMAMAGGRGNLDKERREEIYICISRHVVASVTQRLYSLSAD